jgi:hypothetical protein
VLGGAQVGKGGIEAGCEFPKTASTPGHDRDNEFTIKGGGGSAQGGQSDGIVFLCSFVALDGGRRDVE